MPPDALTLPELKARGWTPALIRDLLGEIDRKQLLEVSEVYEWDQVLRAEQSDAFLVWQARAERQRSHAQKAAASRAANQAKQLAYYAQRPLPVIVPHPHLWDASGEHLWREHLSGLYAWLGQHYSLLEGLSQPLRLKAQTQARERYRRALLTAYGR